MPFNKIDVILKPLLYLLCLRHVRDDAISQYQQNKVLISWPMSGGKFGDMINDGSKICWPIQLNTCKTGTIGFNNTCGKTQIGMVKGIMMQAAYQIIVKEQSERLSSNQFISHWADSNRELSNENTEKADKIQNTIQGKGVRSILLYCICYNSIWCRDCPWLTTRK